MPALTRAIAGRVPNLRTASQVSCTCWRWPNRGAVAITESHMERYRAIFQPPTEEELSLYDPPLVHGVS